MENSPSLQSIVTISISEDDGFFRLETEGVSRLVFVKGSEIYKLSKRNSLERLISDLEEYKERLQEFSDRIIESDIMFIWDSIGNSISKAELKADEEGDTAAMMATAKVINQQFFRIIEKKISATKRANFPYFASLFTITHAYISGQSLVYYGGEGIYKGSTLVFRMCGVISKATDLYATKQGVDLVFARKTQIVTVKNHITNIKTKGTIVCVHNGFIRDDKKDIDEYKKAYRDDWDIKFTEDWAKYNKDSK